MPKILLFSNRPECVQNAFKSGEKYLEFSKAACATARGTLENYSQKQGEQLVRLKINEMMGISDDSNLRDIRFALANTAKREALFQILQETVEETVIGGWESTPFFMEYVETKTLARGDTNSFYVPDATDIVISKTANANHDVIRQRLGSGREFSVNVANYTAKVYMESERYLTGAESWSELIGKISIAYTRYFNNMLHDSVMGAGQSLPSPEQWNHAGELSATKYDEFMGLVDDVATAAGADVTIAGTKTALRGLKKLGDITYVSAEEKRDIYTTGLPAYFEGIKLIEIPQRFAFRDTSKVLVDNTKLLVMPKTIDKFVKLFYEGAAGVRECTDVAQKQDATIEYEMTQRMGIAVVTDIRFGTWTIEK